MAIIPLVKASVVPLPSISRVKGDAISSTEVGTKAAPSAVDVAVKLTVVLEKLGLAEKLAVNRRSGRLGVAAGQFPPTLFQALTIKKFVFGSLSKSSISGCGSPVGCSPAIKVLVRLLKDISVESQCMRNPNPVVGVLLGFVE